MPQASVKELFNKQEYGQVILLCNEALIKKPKDAIAFYNRGRCHQQMEDFSQAILDYREAITCGHNDPEKILEKIRECRFAQGFNKAISSPAEEPKQIAQLEEPAEKPESWCHFFTRFAKATSVAALETAVVYYTIGDRLGMR